MGEEASTSSREGSGGGGGMSSESADSSSSPNYYRPYLEEDETLEEDLDLWRNQTSKLLDWIREDPLGADLTISLFVSAADSFRHPSVLVPAYDQHSRRKEEDEDGIEALRSILRDIPALPHLFSLLKALGNNSQISPRHKRLVRFLYWLSPHRHPAGITFSFVEPDKHEEIIQRVSVQRTSAEEQLREKSPTNSNTSKPSHIFQIRSRRNETWREENKNGRKIYGFHGSKLDNFYSILSNGLQQHRNTTSLFGQGIYLSTDLGLTLTYAKSGKNWDKSIFGSNLGCVVLSEMNFDHPDVKYHSQDPGRNRLDDSQAGNIPEKYIIVRNNDCIINSYLILFGNNASITSDKVKKALELQNSEGNNRFSSSSHIDNSNNLTGSSASNGSSWFKDNKMLILLLAYAVLLLAVGLSQSHSFKRWLRKNGYMAFD